MTDESEKLVLNVPGKPGLLAAAFKAHTENAPEKGNMFSRNTVTVTILDEWTGGVFGEHFVITLAEATPDIELGAAKASDGEPAGMAFKLAEMSMVKLNGDTIDDIKRSWLWGAIGQKGRQAVSLQYAKEFSANGAEIEAALGNPTVGTM